MQYDLQIEHVSSIRRRLRFTLDAATVGRELDRAFQDLRNRVRLPGFRPGKVPREVLEARYGRKVRSDVGARLIDETYQAAAADLPVAGQPAVEQRGEVQGGASFQFTIAVDVRPSVQVKDYRGMKVDYPFAELTDAAVEAAVKRELSRRSRIEEVAEARPVAEGDLVLAEVRLEQDGKVLVDDPGTMLHTRGERYYPGVEALVIGLSKGETRTAPVAISRSAEVKRVAGLTCEATVKVLKIHVHQVPDLDDAIAAELGYEGGAEGMRAAVRMKLQEQAEESARNEARVALLQALVAANPIEVPKGLVDEQFQLLTEELRIRRAYSGLDPRSIRFTDAEMADLRQRAEFAARASCLLAGVAEQEGIAASDADVQAKIQEIADMRGQAVEAIRGYLEREGAVGMLRMRILEEKTLDWLMEQAELRTVDPSQRKDPRDVQGEPVQAAAAAVEQAAAPEPAPTEQAGAAEAVAPAKEAAPAARKPRAPRKPRTAQAEER